MNMLCKQCNLEASVRGLLSLWSAKCFCGLGRCLTGEKAFFSEHFQRPGDAWLLSLGISSSHANQNGSQDQMSLELLPPALVKPVGLQGDKARGGPFALERDQEDARFGGRRAQSVHRLGAGLGVFSWVTPAILRQKARA